MMVKEKYETVILGSGWFSAGYAFEHPDTLILEQHQLADPCFAPSFYCNDVRFEGTVDDAFSDLVQATQIDLMKSEPVLSRFMLSNSIRVLFTSPLLSVEPNEEGFTVCFFSPQGERTVQAEKVIDTRPPRLGTHYRVLIGGLSSALKTILSDWGEITPSHLQNGIGYLTITFREPVSVENARLAFMDQYSSLLPQGSFVIQMALSCYHIPKKGVATDSHGIAMVDELAFANPLASFERGKKMQ